MSAASGSSSSSGPVDLADVDAGTADLDVRLGAFADHGVQSKRFSAEMHGLPVNQQCATDFQPCCSNGVEHEQFDAYSKLTNAQRAVMKG